MAALRFGCDAAAMVGHLDVFDLSRSLVDWSPAGAEQFLGRLSSVGHFHFSSWIQNSPQNRYKKHQKKGEFISSRFFNHKDIFFQLKMAAGCSWRRVLEPGKHPLS